MTKAIGTTTTTTNDSNEMTTIDGEDDSNTDTVDTIMKADHTREGART